MATKKRRIQISLPPELETVLVDLATLTERPISAVISGLLLESIPSLQQVVASLRASKSGKLDVEGFQRALEQGKKDIEQIQDDLNRIK